MLGQRSICITDRNPETEMAEHVGHSLLLIIPCLQSHLHSLQLKTREEEEGSANDLHFLY